MDGYDFQRRANVATQAQKVSCILMIACAILLALTLGVWTGASHVAAQGNRESGYCVIEQASGRVLYEYNKDARLEMASTTKIMTALVALETLDLDAQIRVDDRAIGVEGSSIYLRKNEIWTARDLLHGLMLRSGNDAAVALAIASCGSEEAFAVRMNETARKIGLEQTHFTNPHGLHDDEHYTTAYELAKLSAYAMSNPEFRAIVGAKVYKVAANETHPEHYFANKNKMLASFDGANGIKTGYTTHSGRCLVSAAERDGMQLIGVVLNCYDMWNQSAQMLENGFRNYRNVKLGEAGKALFRVGEGEHAAAVGLETDIVFPLRTDEDLDFRFTIRPHKDLRLPLAQGQEIGRVEISRENRLLFSAKLITMNAVNDAGVVLMLSNLCGNLHIENNGGEIEQIFSVERNRFPTRRG